MSQSPIGLDVATQRPNAAVRDAQSVIDLVAHAEANPDLMARLQTEFGTQIAAAQKNPLVSLAAGVLVGVGAKWGVQIDGATASLLAIAAATLAGDLSQWVSARFGKPKVVPVMVADISKP